jgi:uncharacterized repeat protein (TIGR01451 family)
MCETIILHRSKKVLSQVTLMEYKLALLWVVLFIVLLAPAVVQADAGWRIETVKHVAFPWSGINHRSQIAIGPDGSAHIVAAPTIGLYGPLVYGHKTSGSWSVETVDVGFLGGLGVDSQGAVHTVYESNFYHDPAQYAVKTGGAWSKNNIKSGSHFPSLIVDRTGIVHIAYKLTSNDSPPVCTLRFASRVAGSWVTTDVTSVECGGSNGERTIKEIGVDSKGWGHIAYFRDSGNALLELQLADQTAAGWTTTTIDTVSADTLTFDNILDMAIDGNDHLHIVYWDHTNYYTDGPYVKYATNASGVWTISILLHNAFYPAVAVDMNNKVHVAYNPYFGLKYLNNVSGTWTESTIQTGTGTDNILSDIAVDTAGQVHVSYFEPGIGLLKYAKYPVFGVSIDKLALPDPVMVTGNLTYSITVKNHGPDEAAGVMVTDEIPGGVTLVSVSHSQGTCSDVGTVTCNLGNLAVGASAAVTITATVNPTASNRICNTVNVTASPDPDSSDNTATACVTVARSIVSITVPDPVVCRDTLKPGLLTVSRTGIDNDSKLTMKYSVGGTAIAGVDYQELPGTVEIPAGEWDAQIEVVPISQPLVHEDKTVIVTLSPDPSYIVGVPYSATVTIRDCDNFGGLNWAGTWYVHGIGDSTSANGPYWDWGTLMIDGNGAISGGTIVTSSGVEKKVINGLLTSDTEGQVSGTINFLNGSHEIFTHGKMDVNKNILFWVGSDSNYRHLYIAEKGGGSFSQADLAGTWSLQYYGDNTSSNSPNSAYGTVIVNANGNVTGGFLSSNFWGGDFTGGWLIIDNTGQVSGTLTVTDEITLTLPHGKLDGRKNILTMLDSSFDYRGMFVMVREGGTFTQQDLTGNWYYATFRDNINLNAPLWSYGKVLVDPEGTIIEGTVTNSLGQTDTIKGGSLYISSSGEVTGDVQQENGLTQYLTVGQLDPRKSFLSEITEDSEFLGLFVAIWGGARTILGDMTPPSLLITSHTDHQHVTTASITLSGTASDGGLGSNGIQQVTVNGVRADNDTATGNSTANWRKTVTLFDGPNIFDIIAYDNSAIKNLMIQSIWIFYDPPDTTSPLLNITSHSNGQHVNTANIVLSGWASDAELGDNGIQQVMVNGARATNDTATGSGAANWSKVVTLSSGANTITVVSYDNSSNHNSTTVSLTIYYDSTQKPSVTTGPVTKVTQHSATLNGTVNPNGLSTTYYFEWGKTTAYGNTSPATPASAGSGWGNVAVSTNLTGLTQNTTYHYRLAATNSMGTTYGVDMSFMASVKALPWLELLLGD